MTKRESKKAASAVASTKPAHNNYLDALKGLAILLVVVGHSIQFLAPGDFDANILFRIIYSVHMPFFMFLSGVAASYSSKPMNFKFLKGKFMALVIPFVAWYVVGYFVNQSYRSEAFTAYIHRLVLSPDSGLWFLWVLFLNFCVLALIKKLEGKLKLYSYILVWLLIYAIPTGKFGIGLVKWHLPFFVAGYLIFVYKDVLYKYRKYAYALSAVLFPILALTWHRLYYPWYVTGLEVRLTAHGFSAFRISELASFQTNAFVELFYKYLVPFLGIIFIYWAARIIPKAGRALLAWLGLYTLDIYVSHYFFFRYSIGHGWFAVITGFVFALGGSLLLGIFVLRKVPLLNSIFLGGRFTKKKHPA